MQAIDYHYYASPASRNDTTTYAAMFADADAFVEGVKLVEVWIDSLNLNLY